MPTWNEREIKGAIKAYFGMLDQQESGKPINKADCYRRLAKRFPGRTVKAFEFKFQNISAVLYEQKMPYVNGLLPRSNYQDLLRILVLNYLETSQSRGKAPVEILVSKMRQLAQKGLISVKGAGSGRFGLTLESEIGIPPNSSRQPDFMGIELKTKEGNTLQTLFSRTPSKFVKVKDRLALIGRYGYRDQKKQRRALYTSFNKTKNSLGFFLSARHDELKIMRGNEEVICYSWEDLEESLLTKHRESAFITVVSEKRGTKEYCKFVELLYCKDPSIIRLKKLVSAGKIYLDFTMSLRDNLVKDHGFLWRIDSAAIPALYLVSKRYDLRS